MILNTDTWRASADRVARSTCRGRNVNADHVAYLRELVDQHATEAPAWICGTIGPCGDAYKPAEAPGFAEAVRHHQPQIEELAAADLLGAYTLPATEEAMAIAHASQTTGVPYILSFVIGRDGKILDGTPLETAIDRIDDATPTPPVGFLVNCVHPNVLTAALDAMDRRGADVGNRLIGFVANTADLAPEDLDDSADLITEDPKRLAEYIGVLQRRAGLRLLGGCCGTDERHIGCMAELLSSAN